MFHLSKQGMSKQGMRVETESLSAPSMLEVQKRDWTAQTWQQLSPLFGKCQTLLRLRGSCSCHGTEVTLPP